MGELDEMRAQNAKTLKGTPSDKTVSNTGPVIKKPTAAAAQYATLQEKVKAAQAGLQARIALQQKKGRK